MPRNYIEAFYTFQKYVTYRNREVIRVDVRDSYYYTYGYVSYRCSVSSLKYMRYDFRDIIADLIKLSNNTYILKLNLYIPVKDRITKILRNIIRGCKKYLGVKLDVEVRVLKSSYYCIVIPNGITYRYYSYSPKTIWNVEQNGKRVSIEASACGYIPVDEDPELAELLRKYVRLHRECYEIYHELGRYGVSNAWVFKIPNYDLNVDSTGDEVRGYWLGGTYYEYRDINEAKRSVKNKLTSEISYLQNLISEMKAELTMYRILNA
jgi:hypothetical protein